MTFYSHKSWLNVSYIFIFNVPNICIDRITYATLGFHGSTAITTIHLIEYALSPYMIIILTSTGANITCNYFLHPGTQTIYI